jgi:hypothetical protein
MDNANEFLNGVKVTVAGPIHSGKTYLINQFAYGVTDRCREEIAIRGVGVTGDEMFKFVIFEYHAERDEHRKLNHIDCVIIVYDVTSILLFCDIVYIEKVVQALLKFLFYWKK